MTVEGRLRATVVLLLGERVATTASAALDAAGVAHLVVKGVAAAHVLYDDPLARPFRDVDVCVRWRDLGAARRALGVAGFREERSVRTAHTSLLRPGFREAPDLDLQGWVGYALVPRGGLAALVARARRVTTATGSFVAPDPLDAGCLSALFAVRDRLLPATAPLLNDVARAADRFGITALEGRAASLGLRRFVRAALAAHAGVEGAPAARWARRGHAIWPRAMSVLPSLLLTPAPRALAASTLTAGVLAAELLARAASRRLRGLRIVPRTTFRSAQTIDLDPDSDSDARTNNAVAVVEEPKMNPRPLSRSPERTPVARRASYALQSSPRRRADTHRR